jgi:hypothetical protein
VNLDPAFRDASTNDYRLTATSNALNNGGPIPFIPQDINGNLRSGVFDIGAYEFP